MIGRAAVVVGALAWAAPALPLAAPPPTLADIDVLAGPVPTNLVWLGPPMPVDVTQAWWFRRVGDVEFTRFAVTFDADFTRLLPVEPLAPDADYDLVLTAADDSPTLAPAVRFHTQGADVEPPAPPTILLTHVRQVDPRVCGDWCSAEPRASVHVVVAPDPDVCGYRLERVEPSGNVLVGATLPFVYNYLDGPLLASFEPKSSSFGLQRYDVIAIDAADNRSATRIEIDLGPPAMPEDLDEPAVGCASASPMVCGGLALVALRRHRRRT